MSVFIYLLLAGLLFGGCISGYQYQDALDIIFMGQTGSGGFVIIEVMTAFGFYYLATSFISKWMEKVMKLYDYIQVRSERGKQICVQKMLFCLMQSVGFILLQKILADVLLAICFHCKLGDIYWYQTILLMFSLVMIGCMEIVLFYVGCKPAVMKMYVDILLLILLLCNGKDIGMMGVFIPVFSRYREYLMLLIIGKTMLLRLLCGLIAPTKGAVRGLDSCSFGIMIENPSFLLGETAYYNLDYLASIRKVIGKSEIEDMLKQVGLYHVKDKKVKSFSLGMKQRLGIAQALMENPDVILLDEPFNALDDENFQIVFDLLKGEKEKGKMVAVAAHSLESTVLQEFDEVVVMNDGKISG